MFEKCRTVITLPYRFGWLVGGMTNPTQKGEQREQKEFFHPESFLLFPLLLAEKADKCNGIQNAFRLFRQTSERKEEEAKLSTFVRPSMLDMMM